jgi:hypothetical protein
MKKLIPLLLLIPFLAFSQQQISGLLVDFQTNEILPFANILTNNNQGTITDVDGKFTIESSKKITEIRISYNGYESKTISINENTTFLKIE